MLLSLLRLPSRKWTELLKDMNHHFPRNQEQYKELQRMILREKALESQVLSLAQGSNSSHHFAEGGVIFNEWRWRADSVVHLSRLAVY